MSEKLLTDAAARWKEISEDISAAAAAVGRNPEEITLMAVTKTVPPERVNEVIAAGCRLLGENRVQELLEKYEHYDKRAKIHFIGTLQTNKVKYIVDKVDMIESVDSLHLADEIERRCAAIGKTMDILLEVNIADEESKSGFEPSEVKGIIERARSLEHVKIEGLMSMAPRAEEELINATFSGLANLESELNDTFSQEEGTARLSALSMGMTEDWPVALRYGSTIVRIGRAIFSDSFENA